MRKFNLRTLIFTPVVLILTASAAFAQIDLPPETYDYMLFWGDRKIGYFTYSLAPRTGGWKLESEAFMSISAGGRPGRLRMLTSWNLDPNMLPENYELSIYSGEDLRQHITINISEKTAQFNEGTSSFSADFPEDAFILETTLPDGWILLAKRIDIAADSMCNITALVPQMGKSLPMTIFPGQYEKTGGDESRKFTANIGGVDVEFFAKTLNRMITYWSVPGRGITARYTPNLDKDAIISAASAPDILEKLMTQNRLVADIDVESPLLLSKLSVALDLQLSPDTGPLLDGRYQDFDGEIIDGKIFGLAKLRVKAYEGKGAMGYPAGPIVEPESGSLFPSTNIQSDSPDIAAVAGSLISDCGDVWCAAKLLNRFVADSVALNAETRSSLTALALRNGNAIAHSRLCVALLRSVGIPAKIVGGLFLNNGFWVRHHWVLVWAGNGAGWVPIDPTTGEDVSFSPAHILLWNGEGHIEPKISNSVVVESYDMAK